MDNSKQSSQPGPVLTLREFCEQHRISRNFFYSLVKDGQAPDVIKVRHRVLISNEAAAAWRLRFTSKGVRRG